MIARRCGLLGGIEQRSAGFVSLTEARRVAARSGSAGTLAGMAIPYGQQSRELGPPGMEWVEMIEPGAFAGSIEGEHGLWLDYMHDRRAILASRDAGTLKIDDSPRALDFEADLAPTSLGRDIAALLSRGDLDGAMSFDMIVEEDRWETRGRIALRRVIRGRLLRLSLVDAAAYPQTNSALRHVAERFAHGARRDGLRRLALKGLTYGNRNDRASVGR